MRIQAMCFTASAVLAIACGNESDGTSATAAPDVTADGAADGGAEPDSAAPLGRACEGAAAGTPCDDGNACTTSDVCSGSVCVGQSTLQCDDTGPCQTATCDPAVGCVTSVLPDGAPCERACFGAAACQAGACVPEPESAVSCPEPADPCVSALACDPTTNACTAVILAAPGTACDADGDVCTFDECNADGKCAATGNVDDCAFEQQNNPCWTYSCNKKGGCVQTLFVEGVSCDDGNPCTTEDVCTLLPSDKEACLGVPLPMDDGNPCTADSCDAGEVLHAPLTGVPCAPPGECTGAALCEAGVCMPAGTDTCGGGCSEAADCQEVACHTVTCQDGACAYAATSGCTVCATEADCPPQVGCVASACDQLSGTCTPVSVEGCATCESDADCDDSNPCTDDHCHALGYCEAQPVDSCCTTDADCADGSCVDGTCFDADTEPCSGLGCPCAVDDHCDDGIAGNKDSCVDGGCVFVDDCEGPGVGVLFALDVPDVDYLFRLEGNYIGVFWEGPGLWFQLFTTSGCKLGSAKQVATGYPTYAAPHPDGGFVTWGSESETKRYASTGIPMGDGPGGGAKFVILSDGGVAFYEGELIRLGGGGYCEILGPGDTVARFRDKDFEVVSEVQLNTPDVILANWTYAAATGSDSVATVHRWKEGGGPGGPYWWAAWTLSADGAFSGPSPFDKTFGPAPGRVVGLADGSFAAVYKTSSSPAANYMRFAESGSHVSGSQLVLAASADSLPEAVPTFASGFFVALKSNSVAHGFLVGPACSGDADCADGNPCTYDTCTAHGCGNYYDPVCD